MACTCRLAAQADVVGVILGSIIGHAACTGAAVLGGKHLAEHIDEKIVGVSICKGLAVAVCIVAGLVTRTELVIACSVQTGWMQFAQVTQRGRPPCCTTDMMVL
eukprot:GHRR01022850.1.p2 GENE.GHRR01022850.1~~GHRR01022850.1.p2  ORF type:complete len:104 (-),score=24.25 GHRR01022850.1:577-888(-)